MGKLTLFINDASSYSSNTHCFCYKHVKLSSHLGSSLIPPTESGMMPKQVEGESGKMCTYYTSHKHFSSVQYCSLFTPNYTEVFMFVHRSVWMILNYFHIKIFNIVKS